MAVFPVGHFNKLGVSSVVVKNGSVIGFVDPWGMFAMITLNPNSAELFVYNPWIPKGLC